MQFKKPGLLLASYSSCLSSCSPNHQFSTSSPTTPFTSQQRNTATPTKQRRWERSRAYATAVDDERRRATEHLHWPDTGHVQSTPTPYQIFNQKKGAPYSKRRFYELVKLYHPDRNGHTHNTPYHHVPHTVRLERYRLVVAANNILSDPVKRSAYDRYGAGWNGQPEVRGPRYGSGHEAGEGWANNSGWSGGQSPSQNATWEDWERWYQRDAKGPQEPQFFSNSAFVSFVVILAALGGIGQATRATNFSTSFIEQCDQAHEQARKELFRARRETAIASGNKDERIQTFLKKKDPIGYAITDPQEDSYRRLLPAPEVCSSEDIKERKMGGYRQEEGSDR